MKFRSLATECADRVKAETMKVVSNLLTYCDVFPKKYDKYLEVMGTTLCPELQKQIYGRSFIFTDPADCEEYWKIEDHAEKCAVVVEKATRMIAEFLLDNEKAE